MRYQSLDAALTGPYWKERILGQSAMTAGTLLASTGELADKIADHLSHEETSTTTKHYVARGEVEAAQAERAFSVIAGGRR